MSESTMLLIIEVLANRIKELQLENQLLKYDNERIKQQIQKDGINK